ncbi:MAG: response regulator transcription factor [Lachnospiraceae bacterium]|nr:response regulator transcription factor [Lachnospiraceae bacterium]
MVEILLVEDDESVNRGITFSMEKEGYHVYSCQNLQEAKRAMQEQYPDILLCDVNLPDGSGLELVSMVRAGGNAFIICLTARDQETDQVMGYGAGADDYITKPFSLSVLSLKIRAYLERRAGIKKNRILSGRITVELDTMKVFRQGQEISLTRNEWKLLKLFLENSGRILSKNQILEQLFDADGNFVDGNTVAVNVNRLREKIEPDKSKPVYIKNIRGLGYIWSQETRYA